VFSTYTFGSWKQPPETKKDGYVIGNGKIYVMSGHGVFVEHEHKATYTDRQVCRTYIPAISAPFYTNGNLAHGFEVKHTEEWEEETVKISENGFTEFSAQY